MGYLIFELTEKAFVDIKSVFRGEIFSQKKDGKFIVKATDAQAKIVEAYCGEGIIEKRDPFPNE